MYKKIIKLICLPLSLTLAFSVVSLTAYATENSARLHEIYGDEMLFQQNKNINIAGTASAGTLIMCELIKDGEVIQSASSTSKADTSFIVTMPGIEGGYTEYDIACYANGNLFKTLKNVVFGELWLTSGQSNMQLPMRSNLEGSKMVENNQLGDVWVRYLNIPATPEYKGSSDKLPLQPQNDIKSAKWYNGTQNGTMSASAVGFFFAEKMQKEINMPVGLITAALGGSSIYTWLSREAIENNQAVLQNTKQIGVYYSESQWNESNQNTYRDITANYNNKIHALAPF